MYVVLALIVGALYTAGLYLMFRRSLVKLLFGLVLLGHAANLLLFVVGGLVRASPPIARLGAEAPDAGSADPVPQALVLTAIVIGFAVVAFTAVLVRQVYRVTGTDDVDELREDP